MGHLRRPRAGAPVLGRGRPLSAPAAAGPLVRLLNDRLADATSQLWTDEDTVEVQVPGDKIVDTLRTLRDDPAFAFFFLADAAAVDYGVGEHFEVVYHLYSDKHPLVAADPGPGRPQEPGDAHRSPSLWAGAMFHEREMYDMMGIVFAGNRDLRRIYMSPDYRSFPQRKDFLLPDDAADSPAAGNMPLERPETWDLTRLEEAAAHRDEPGEPV